MAENQIPEEWDPKNYKPDPVPPSERDFTAPADLGWTEAQKSAFCAELERVAKVLTAATHSSLRQIAREKIERDIQLGKI